MPTIRLQLLDFPGNYEEGTLPYGPKAYVALKFSSKVTWRNKSGSKENDFTVITPECVTPEEFNCNVDILIKELQTIKKQAQSFFKKDLDKRKQKASKET